MPTTNQLQGGRRKKPPRTGRSARHNPDLYVLTVLFFLESELQPLKYMRMECCPNMHQWELYRRSKPQTLQSHVEELFSLQRNNHLVTWNHQPNKVSLRLENNLLRFYWRGGRVWWEGAWKKLKENSEAWTIFRGQKFTNSVIPGNLLFLQVSL